MAAGRLAVEIYYDGAWHDITADDDVFAAPIVIKRGQSDEATQLRPASIAMTLANDDDRYRTSNPESPLYGKAGLNTPTRISVDGTVRGTVEASSWAADQTRDFRVSPPRGKAWVDFEGGGLLQRMGQWTDVVESTMTKGIRSFGADLIGAWPLEDASSATILTNIVSGGAPGAFTDGTLADGERPAGSAQSVKLGASGQLSFTFARSTASGWQISFAFKLPALPGSATYEEIFYWYDSVGRRWTWEVNNANFGWTVYDNDGTTVLESLASSYSGTEPNQWIRVKTKCTVSGSTITYEPSWYAEGTSSEVGTSGTFTGTSTGCLDRAFAAAHTYNNGGWYTGVFGIDNAAAAIFNAGVIQDFNGHAGETTAARFGRLMDDAGLAYTVIGDTANATRMGGQPVDTLPNLFKEIVATEDGLLFDDIDAIALVLILRDARLNQTPLTLFLEELPAPPREVTDDLGVYNVVTASQSAGGSVTVEDATSPMGSQPPPDGRGEYSKTINVNVADETSDLPQQANWWLRRGTVNLPRYPELTVNLGALDAVTAAAVDAVEVGDVITIAGFREYTVRLHVLGWVETIRPADQGKVRRTIVFTCAPDQQFQTGVYDGDTTYTPRYDLRTCTLNGDHSPTVTTLTLAITNDEAWSTTSAYDLLIAGELVGVPAGGMGARSGSVGAYAQTLTGAVRSKNGIRKTLPDGSEVHIATPGRWVI